MPSTMVRCYTVRTRNLQVTVTSEYHAAGTFTVSGPIYPPDINIPESTITAWSDDDPTRTMWASVADLTSAIVDMVDANA